MSYGTAMMRAMADKVFVNANSPGRRLSVNAFTVAVVLEGVELTDDVLDALFDALPDAVPSSLAGVVEVSSPVEAPDAETAAMSLVAKLRSVLPGARAVRLDQDLVSISDIAERTGRSRESIRLLADSRRGPGGFPVPVGTVGDGIRVWPWAVVVEWFRDALDEDLGERGVPPEIAAVVDAALSGRSRGRAPLAS
jgi:hypothetical protein